MSGLAVKVKSPTEQFGQCPTDAQAQTMATMALGRSGFELSETIEDHLLVGGADSRSVITYGHDQTLLVLLNLESNQTTTISKFDRIPEQVEQNNFNFLGISREDQVLGDLSGDRKPLSEIR